MSTSPEKRNRERERRRRKPVEPTEELPSFPEPRRINVERQDSLSNKIQAVLGHMGKIHNVIGRDPNVWLGTSRNASVNKNNSSSAATDNKDKGAHTKSQASGYHNQRSKQQPSNRQYPAGTSSSSSYSTKSNPAYSSNSNAGGDHPRLESDKSSHFNHSGARQIKDNSSPGYKGRDTTKKLRDPSPKQISSAKDLPSLDMPVAMESIFQEMKMNEPLSEIQTPCLSNGQEFNFAKNEARTDPLDGSNELMPDDAGENSDDSDTSDDDDSDTDESDHESPSSQVNWSLTEFMPEYQKPTEIPVVGTDADNDKHGRTTNTYREQQEEAQSFQKSSTRGRLNQQDAQEPQNRSTQAKRASAKDGEDRKKANEERSRARNRPASVSSFGSVSPVRHHTPTDVSRSSDTLRVPRDGHYGRDSSQESRRKERLHKTSQSKSCSPVPRNYEKTRSDADPKHQKRFSPQRSTSKSHNTVRTKEIKSIPSPSADYNTSPAIPSSVRNETLPSSQPFARAHQRTANKSSPTPSSRQTGRVAKKTAAVTTSPVRDQLSDSDSSSDDDDDNHSVSSGSSSSNSEDEYPSRHEDRQSPSRGSPWSAISAPQSNPTISKPNTKRKTFETRDRISAKEHTEGHYSDNNVPVRKKPRKKLEPNGSSSQPCNQDTNVNQPFNIDKDSSQASSSSPSVTAALIKTDRKYKNSPGQHQQQYQPTPRIKEPNRFPPLWVKLPTNRSNLSAVVELCNMKTPTQHLARSEVDGKGKKLENDLLPSKSASKFDNIQSTMACSAATSAGSQSLIPNDMIPSRRADSVQVAVAASTSEMSPNSQSALQKRKLPKQSSTYLSSHPNHSPIPNHKAKRRKQDSASPYQEGDSMQTLPTKQPKKHGQMKTGRKVQSNTSSGSQRWQQPNEQNTSGSSQQSNSSAGSQQPRPTKVDPNKPHHSSSQSSDITAGPADSSWPENETRIKTSDHYMREGKRLKHEGDACTDSRTGRTRAGEALNRALIYYEAALCFIMNGYTLELENANDRAESSHLSSNMYMQTIQLMDYIRKMRPHDQQEECTFKRLKISCLRSQALLYLGIYKLKKDAAFKCSEFVTETLKPSKSNRTPSPWNVVNGQNVVSPVSPAVPSPYGGNVAGPSPVAGASNTCEQVTSSTQVNKIASPPSQNGVVLPPKAADVFRQFHNTALNVMQAHEKWDQAESLLPEHKDFFRHVDVLTAHELKMNSSLRDLATYNKVILRQLRGAYKSPQE